MNTSCNALHCLLLQPLPGRSERTQIVQPGRCRRSGNVFEEILGCQNKCRHQTNQTLGLGGTGPKHSRIKLIHLQSRRRCPTGRHCPSRDRNPTGRDSNKSSPNRAKRKAAPW
uniref:BPTI/Kunitz inhibitor domain-containing protein n=1 Tax=Anopheles merus TaxID=30066 RepID=A0A182UTR5_ANOME